MRENAQLELSFTAIWYPLREFLHRLSLSRLLTRGLAADDVS